MIDTGDGPTRSVSAAPRRARSARRRHRCAARARGRTGADFLFVDDTADATTTPAALRPTTHGLGMGGQIHYTDVRGADGQPRHRRRHLLRRLDPHRQDDVNSGRASTSSDRDDRRPHLVNSEAGNDEIRVNESLLDRPRPRTASAPLLTLDGGTGSDLYIVINFGNGDSRSRLRHRPRRSA